ncbi:MAG: 2-C-methyl-D-erythritol 4-phosphate cytidylyltransferase [Candidatus Latescibacterota bacterium]
MSTPAGRPRVAAIVAAGGQGTRMGSATPKQFLPVGGRPLLRHTLDRLEASAWVDAIVLVVGARDLELCRTHVLGPVPPARLRCLVPGGPVRQESVRAGLACLAAEDEVVLVHDGVRPFASEYLIGRVVRAAVEHGAAVPALPARETLKEVRDGFVVRTPDRSRLWTTQTPQGFRRALLEAAYDHARDGVGATDDAALVERLGHPVQVVEGEAANVKITTPEDLAWAEQRLVREGGTGRAAPAMRVGLGYDVHRLQAGRRLVLGGVEIPFARGLEGHSDADVLVHAIIDSLLGAAGCGDIGRLFPDTDPQYRGISSLVLLERVREVLAEQGVRVQSVDAVVMAQRPPLAPHVLAMTARVAAALGVEPVAVSIKATTTERLGFVGREEGLAAQAVALVAR